MDSATLSAAISLQDISERTNKHQYGDTRVPEGYGIVSDGKVEPGDLCMVVIAPMCEDYRWSTTPMRIGWDVKHLMKGGELVIRKQEDLDNMTGQTWLQRFFN